MRFLFKDNIANNTKLAATASLNNSIHSNVYCPIKKKNNRQNRNVGQMFFIKYPNTDIVNKATVN